MINYDKKFNAEINRVVRNFNAKVRRLEHQGLRYLPETVSVADLKSTYFDRDSLKRKLKQLERFSTSGAEQIVQTAGGAKTTKWELQALREERDYLRKRYAKKIMEYGNIVPTSLGKRQDVSYAKMGDARYENLKVLKKSVEKDITMLDQYDFNRVKKSTFAQIRRYHRQKYVLYANYFTFLEDVAYKADIDEETLNKIKDKLAQMDIDKFMEFFETERAFSAIIDYYNIQKVLSDGYSQDTKQLIQEMFKSINEVADEYL